MEFLTLKDTIRATITTASTINASDLLTLRDMLRDMAGVCNDTYMDTPYLYTHTCECGTRFSILDTPREDRRPETCVECYEKCARPCASGLRDPKYDYKSGF